MPSSFPWQKYPKRQPKLLSGLMFFFIYIIFLFIAYLPNQNAIILWTKTVSFLTTVHDVQSCVKYIWGDVQICEKISKFDSIFPVQENKFQTEGLLMMLTC